MHLLCAQPKVYPSVAVPCSLNLYCHHLEAMQTAFVNPTLLVSRIPRHYHNTMPRSRASADPADARSPQPPSKRPRHASIASTILAAEKRMSEALSSHTFASPVTHVYNPLEYAWSAHEWYVNRFGNTTKHALLVGMNPGPWGMAQTGVPFGEVSAVRDFLGMPADTLIAKPSKENAARPVTGLECSRSEVSGKRLWLEWGKKEYETAERMFENLFVHNYCPLMMMESSGRNRTPVQLRAAERNKLNEVCDVGLREVVMALQVKVVCGLGGYAEQRCKAALKDLDVVVCRVLHPSPASPAANRGWATVAKKQIEEAMAAATLSTDR